MNQLPAWLKIYAFLFASKLTCMLIQSWFQDNFHWQGLEHRKSFSLTLQHKKNFKQRHTDKAFHLFDSEHEERKQHWTTSTESLWNTRQFSISLNVLKQFCFLIHSQYNHSYCVMIIEKYVNFDIHIGVLIAGKFCTFYI